MQSFLLHQVYTHSNHTEDGTTKTFETEYEFCKQEHNVQNENLHKILHKNDKRDWMYDAVEKRYFVIKS